MEKVIVVFPARNEAETIARCIEVVKQSQYTRVQASLLVANAYLLMSGCSKQGSLEGAKSVHIAAEVLSLQVTENP